MSAAAPRARPGLAARLGRWLSPEEHRVALDGGRLVHDYLEAYHSAGRQGAELDLADLAPAHGRLRSSLHRGAGSDQVAVTAFLYSAFRLPDCMPAVDTVVLASSRAALEGHLGVDRTAWRRVEAAKRRRLAFFDGGRRLAVQVASQSDLDDIIPGLTAFQIEWNKMHQRLAGSALGAQLASGERRAGEARRELRHALGLNRPDLEALVSLWGRDWDAKLAALAAGPKHITLRLLPVREEDYAAAADDWWSRAVQSLKVRDLAGRPVYLVTSNTHALRNLVSGFTTAHEPAISGHAAEHGGPELAGRLRELRGEDPVARLNLLYFAQEALLRADPALAEAKREMEARAGFRRARMVHPLLAEVQALRLDRIDPAGLDPRLRVADPAALARSRAVIVNTDYPLGLAAFHLLSAAGRLFRDWRGLFILGKSAAMIGRLGDILIPSQVRDVHSQRLYRFPNCFSARHLAPYLRRAAVFDDQRSLTVHGTFLHSWETVRNLHRADFTGIEMEAGPCLAAMAGHCGVGPDQGPGLCRLEPPGGFLLGMLHYTSDTPYNLRASLLSRPLGLTGLEATYCASLAILQRILDQECGRGAAFQAVGRRADKD